MFFVFSDIFNLELIRNCFFLLADGHELDRHKIDIIDGERDVEVGLGECHKCEDDEDKQAHWANCSEDEVTLKMKILMPGVEMGETDERNEEINGPPRFEAAKASGEAPKGEDGLKSQDPEEREPGDGRNDAAGKAQVIACDQNDCGHQSQSSAGGGSTSGAKEKSAPVGAETYGGAEAQSAPITEADKAARKEVKENPGCDLPGMMDPEQSDGNKESPPQVFAHSHSDSETGTGRHQVNNAAGNDAGNNIGSDHKETGGVDVVTSDDAASIGSNHPVGRSSECADNNIADSSHASEANSIDRSSSVDEGSVHGRDSQQEDSDRTSVSRGASRSYSSSRGQLSSLGSGRDDGESDSRASGRGGSPSISGNRSDVGSGSGRGSHSGGRSGGSSGHSNPTGTGSCYGDDHEDNGSRGEVR